MRLDFMTLKGLEELIVKPPGIFGFESRTIAEVEYFFILAGATRQEAARVAECLQRRDSECILRFLIHLSRNEDISKVVLRLASPLEYGGDERRLKKALEILNRLLKAEGFAVKIHGVKPVIVPVDTPDFSGATSETPPAPATSTTVAAIDLPAPIAGELLSALEFWNAEYQKCLGAGALLASVVLLGAMLEAALFLALNKHPDKANKSPSAPKQNGGVKPFNKWTLSEMIDAARALKWIGDDAKQFGHGLRNYRNFIHPRELMKTNTTPDKETVQICAQVVQKTLNELDDKGLLK